MVTNKLVIIALGIICLVSLFISYSCSIGKVNLNDIAGVYFLSSLQTKDGFEEFNNKNFEGAIEIGRFVDTKNL